MPLETNKVFVGDAVHLLKDIPDGSISLVATDPPYGIDYQYDVYDDSVSGDAYVEWCRTWGREVCRALSPTGTFWLAIGDEHVSDLDVLFRRELGLTRRNWCVWHYTFGPNQRKKFTPSHTHLLYYVKDPKRFTFNGNALKVPSKRQQMGDKRAAPGGRVPDDVWQYSRVCGTFKERTAHPCQMPEAVMERIIVASSNPGDVVLDPFAGSGTTLAVAERLGRRWLGFELSPAYAGIIHERLANGSVAKSVA